MLKAPTFEDRRDILLLNLTAFQKKSSLFCEKYHKKTAELPENTPNRFLCAVFIGNVPNVVKLVCRGIRGNFLPHNTSAGGICHKNQDNNYLLFYG